MRIPGITFVQGRNAYADRDSTKYGIAIHNTSNDASAKQEAAYATRRTDGVSAHFYVDRDSVVQSLDTSARAGHAGSSNGNEHAVAVEIAGVNGWSRQQWLDRIAWDQLGWVLAAVCKQYGIAVRRASIDEMKKNPKVKAIYSHDDMRRAWGGTTHTDPGPNFPWDRLFAAARAVGVPTEDDDMTPQELASWDGFSNPYGDKATNPKITLDTHLRNIASNAVAASAAAQAARSEVAELRTVVTNLVQRPTPAPGIVSDEQLERVLRRVIGSVDGSSPAV